MLIQMKLITTAVMLSKYRILSCRNWQKKDFNMQIIFYYGLYLERNMTVIWFYFK